MAAHRCYRGIACTTCQIFWCSSFVVSCGIALCLQAYYTKKVEAVKRLNAAKKAATA